jgi:hypothetical protein
MGWRHPNASETDHELIWLVVSCVSFAVAVFWLKLGLPVPRCLFHEMTRYPCLTCGATRCLSAFSSGRFVEAFFWNPLAFFSLVAVLLYDLYAAVVIGFNLPRFRFNYLKPWVAMGMRLAAVLVALGNWAYLLHAGI